MGRYSEDAEEAVVEAECLVNDSLDCAEVWDAEDWLFSNTSLKDIWGEHETIEDAAEKAECCVESNQYIDGDFKFAILAKALAHFDQGEWSKLYPNHVKELRLLNDITQDEYDDFMEEQ